MFKNFIIITILTIMITSVNSVASTTIKQFNPSWRPNNKSSTYFISDMLVECSAKYSATLNIIYKYKLQKQYNITDLFNKQNRSYITSVYMLYKYGNIDRNLAIASVDISYKNYKVKLLKAFQSTYTKFSVEKRKRLLSYTNISTWTKVCNSITSFQNNVMLEVSKDKTFTKSK